MSRSTPSPKPPADFQQVSRTIARRATNGLATAIVLVAGLAFGRQIMLWWHEEPPAAALNAPPLNSLAGGLGQRELNFGSATAHLRTETVRGERAAAIHRLRKLVAQAGASGNTPAAPAGPAEARLMAEIAKETSTGDAGQLRIDAIDERLPTVVASRTFGDRKLASARRIVAVGFAIPADDGWTLYAFEFSGRANSDGETGGVPLPPDSRRSLSLRQSDGSTLTAFYGNASPLDWEQFFQNELPRQGWRLASDWKSAAGRCTARYSRSSPDSRDEQPAAWLDVHFGPDERGQLCGTVTISAAQ